MNLQRIVHDNRTGPDAVYQFVFGDKLPGRLGKDFDDFKGPTANWHWQSKDPKLAASKVDLTLTGDVDRPNSLADVSGGLQCDLSQLAAKLTMWFIAASTAAFVTLATSNVSRIAHLEYVGNLRGSGSMDENQIRAALDRHWAASDANDFDVEHDIYRDDAVLEYPQSGERIRGRHNIQASRTAQPSAKRFSVRRIVGKGDLWVSEFIITYDGQPSYSVSIMEFQDGRVARETQYFGDPFEPGPSRADLVERIK
jgi:SnoaL-like domain